MRAASPVGVVGALFRVAVAYFDRQAAGDWARASVLSSIFVDTYNEHRARIVEYARSRGITDAVIAREVPTRVTNPPDTTTLQAMAAMLVLGGRVIDGFAAAVQRIPSVIAPDAVRPWWADVSSYLTPLEQQLASEVSSMPVATLAANVESRVSAGIYGGTATSYVDERTTPFDVPGSPGTTVLGPETTITPTLRPRFTVPTWGWWAIGLGGVAAVGVLYWGVYQGGFADVKRSARRVVRRRRRGRR